MNRNPPLSNDTLDVRSSAPKEEGLRINGHQQVLELLRFADPAFRESLLRRLTQKDPKLAQSLRKHLR